MHRKPIGALIYCQTTFAEMKPFLNKQQQCCREASLLTTSSSSQRTMLRKKKTKALYLIGFLTIALVQIRAYYKTTTRRYAETNNVPVEILAGVPSAAAGIKNASHKGSEWQQQETAATIRDTTALSPVKPPPRFKFWVGSQLRAKLDELWEDLDRYGSDRTDEEQQRLLTNAFVRTPAISYNDITMTTHGTVSKLDRLLIQLSWWDGPASVAIYITDPIDIGTLVDFLEANQDRLKKARFHILLEKTELMYPHNTLRNLALNNVESDYFLALDGDFIPPMKSHQGLFNLIRSNTDLREKLRSRVLFVLPAFEVLQQPNDKSEPSSPSNQTHLAEHLLPRDKHSALKAKDQGTLAEFHLEAFAPGQRATDYPRWLRNQTGAFYMIEYEEQYEPYVLGYRHGVPKLWNRFRGYGYNKASWFLQLDRAGYQFAVLRDYFVSHLYHPSNRNQKNRRKVMKHWNALKRHLKRVYGE